jgi:uncharacterized protein
MRTAVLVVAKAPVAGLAKTRLTPPATPRQAARIAAAALLDTLDAARGFATGLDSARGFAGAGVADGGQAGERASAAGAHRVVVAMTGRVAEAERAAEVRRALRGVTVLPQRGDGFAHRLANAHLDTARACPGFAVLQVGMDTPQLTPATIAGAVARLSTVDTVDTVDAVLGPAEDGGWWALGLRDPRQAEVLRAVPMSRPDTGARTLHALRQAGLRVTMLPELSDVDTVADATRVAALCPGTRFARAVSDAFELARTG